MSATHNPAMAVQPPEIPSYGPVRASVGANDPPSGRRPGSVHDPYMNSPEQVNTLSVRNTGSEQSSVFAPSRVMSPNDPSNMMLEANQHVLLGLQCRCQICNLMTPDPSLCASCGLYGHPICINVEHFQGYAFCSACMGFVTSQYASMSDARLRHEWQLSLSSQVWSWKERARDAVGASASIGIAVGGAAAAAAGAAFAVAQGIVQGASGAASGGVGADFPSPPQPDPSFSRPLAIRRSNSTGDLGDPTGEMCPKCDLGMRKNHTYRGSCRGLPPGAYFKHPRLSLLVGQKNKHLSLQTMRDPVLMKYLSIFWLSPNHFLEP